MSDALDRLAQAYGIELSYVTERGEHCVVSDETKRRLLQAMGVAVADEQAIAANLGSAPQLQPKDGGLIESRCFMPDWLADGRVWGITCQLYGLRSDRNWGIGDFEDLAQLTKLAASAGADFIGVNPLHALFLADPSKYSPYAPSSRQFLNPLYISIEKLAPAMPGVDKVEIQAARDAKLVDYVQVARLKRQALTFLYRDFRASKPERGHEAITSFLVFCAERGAALRRFALYEALSEELVAKGHHAGWHSWPEPYRSRDSGAVRRFERENEHRIAFHMWLQWIAESQLKDVQQLAMVAGMRIGLYLDLAVGVAPDGADTWSQPNAVITGARLGCPPDQFNHTGQDWGLAPLSPTALATGDLRPFEAVLAESMRSAGAVRIDHAMGLVRLYLIPAESPATEGAYVRYPMRELLGNLARVSRQRSAIVIGEDLGTVPAGFRELMREAEIQGYRVLYFEREDDGRFRPPHAYSHRAFACLSTHDLPTLKGWWAGSDIDERERIGAYSAEGAAQMRESRAKDRMLLLGALRDAELLPQDLHPVLVGTSLCPAALPAELCVAAHALLARASSRLVAVQLEDLAGVKEQANLPGTVDQHPNWRRKLPIGLERVANTTLFQRITQTVARERPRQS